MKLTPWVDGFVVNISSPNTKDLRKLLEPDQLRAFLEPVQSKLRESGKPWFLKLSPDVTDTELKQILTISMEAGVDGWILANTTVQMRETLRFPTEGGVSGRPLGVLSKRLLYTAVSFLGPAKKDRLIISVGGIMDEDDVQERLALGADLVQVYSALIFQGPWFFRKVARWQQEKSR
jgi:dihydroorotate dehydrogenase